MHPTKLHSMQFAYSFSRSLTIINPVLSREAIIVKAAKSVSVSCEAFYTVLRDKISRPAFRSILVSEPVKVNRTTV